jgi:hypothetical protein
MIARKYRNILLLVHINLVSFERVLVDDDELQGGEAAGLEAEGGGGVSQPAAPLLGVEVRLVLVHLTLDGPGEARAHCAHVKASSVYYPHIHGTACSCFSNFGYFLFILLHIHWPSQSQFFQYKKSEISIKFSCYASEILIKI